MRHYGDYGGCTAIHKSFAIGATVYQGSVVLRDNTAGTIKLAAANAYSVAVGVTTEAATYSTTQGTGASSAAAYAEVCCAFPGALFAGRASGGTTRDTEFAKALDGNILLNSTASAGGTVVSDTNVGTSEFVGGMLICLVGSNKGQFRSISAHTDNTSTTVTVPFDYALAVNDEFLRIHAPLQEGVELTGTQFDQFNAKPGAGVDLPDTGHAQIIEVLVRTQGGPGAYPKTRHSGVTGSIGHDLLPDTPSAPYVEYVFQFIDPVFNHGA